jgi:hypothetical protein
MRLFKHADVRSKTAAISLTILKKPANFKIRGVQYDFWNKVAHCK